MPTISQLPEAGNITASDLLPISQGGSAHAVSVGTLLAQTQPAIIVEPPSLLGRFSIGAGGPDAIAIGDGLTLNNGTLIAKGFDPATLPVQTNLTPSDQLIVTSDGVPQLLGVSQVRGLFSAGSNIAIDTSGVISALATNDTSAYSVTGLTAITALASSDLVGVSQAGENHSISYSNFIDGLTIDQAQPADAASDTDAFWVAQTTNIMLRQTLGSLWPWMSGKLTSWQRPVVELGSNTTLASAVHNNALLVCSSPVLISAQASNLGSGFTCEIVNTSTGTVAFSGNVIMSNGSTGLSSNQCGTILCATYSAGSIVFISTGTGGSATVLPGQAYNLTASSINSGSVTLAWSTPTSGGAVLGYAIQYRITGSSAWLVGAHLNNTNSFPIDTLEPATSYDFTVSAENNVGAGPASSTLTVATPATTSLPGAPINVTITSITANSMNCAWTSPTTGGTGLSYILQYRVSGQSAWNSAATNISSTTFNITNLLPATSYDIQATASNSLGSGPPSALTTIETIQSGGMVSSLTWQLVPTGSYTHGAGTIGVNAHVNPATATIQFGFSMSSTIPPTTWDAGAFVNSDLWGQYVPTPASPGTWYAWAEGTDGSAPTVYATPFTVT